MAKDTPETPNPAPDESKTVIPAPRPEGPKSIVVGDTEFDIVQQVNVPVLKHGSGETVLVRIEQPIRHELSSREIEVAVASGEMVKGKQDTQIAVTRVTELNSGQLFNLVLNAITASELERTYNTENENKVPAYVGKCFAIRKLGTVQGKRYKDVQIIEIKPKAATPAQ